MRRGIRIGLSGAACLLSLTAMTNCIAGNLQARDILEDTKLYFTAPASWDKTEWAYFGGALLAVGAAHEYDADVRRHFAAGSHAATPGTDPDGTKEFVPTAALLLGTATASLLMHSQDGYSETWSMVEAGAFSLVTASALKYAFGRERPNDTTRTDAWFEGGDSFPSVHTTLAFAVGTVLAESGNDRYRWIRRAIGYGVAGGTAYLRMRDNVHWLSDTVAGAALGMASAHFAMNRRDGRHGRASLGLMPVERGLVLNFSMPVN